MDLETARASAGKWVTYDDGHGDTGEGVISSVSERVVFVRFKEGVKACPFASLTLLAGKPAERWEPRLAAHAAGEAPFKFARQSADEIRLIGERDRLCSLAGEALDIVAIGLRSGPVTLHGAATFRYRAPDGTEYEVIVRDLD